MIVNSDFECFFQTLGVKVFDETYKKDNAQLPVSGGAAFNMAVYDDLRNCADCIP